MATNPNQAPVNPGSFNELLEQTGLEPTNPEAIARHSQEVYEYRLALAAFQGVTLEELHQGAA